MKRGAEARAQDTALHQKQPISSDPRHRELPKYPAAQIDGVVIT
jgi:hypothetical protein